MEVIAVIRDHLQENENVKPNTAFLEELKNKLPEFFNNDGFDIDKFKNALEENNVNEFSEGYQLNFIGKDYARKQAGDAPTSVIVPDNEHNRKEENKNSKNLFFTGDNLEVLRHLRNNYPNKIDVIYIDPPYNTGKDDFVYPDKFEYSDKQLEEFFGMSDEDVSKLDALKGSKSHSAWLTFMYPRLWLAKQLLADNGVIFISVDDNEQANLKNIMDGLYGKQNFIANMIIDATPKNDPLMIATSHEYVLVYVKNVNEAKENKWGHINEWALKLKKVVKGLPKEEAEKKLKRYFKENKLKRDNISNYKYVDEKGIYRVGPLDDPQGKGPKDSRKNLKTGNLLKVPSRGWRTNVDTWNKWVNEGLIEFPEDDTKLAAKKTYLTAEKLEVGRSVLKFQTRKTVNYLKKIFNTNTKIFNNPKPIDLIKYLISLNCNNEITILDFFAGSATTADAVMQLNAEDGGNRKFIMVQLPEKTYVEDKNENEIPTKGGKAAFEAGYKSIDEISRERIKRAAKKIKEENPDLKDNFDGGFKHYWVVSPEKETLDKIYDFDPENYELVSDMVESFSSSALGVPGNASGEDTILTTWLAEDGYDFNTHNLVEYDFAGYKTFGIKDTRLYLIDNDWHSEQTKELLNQLGTNKVKFQSIVVYGYSFNVMDMKELDRGLLQLNSKVELIKRY